MALESVEYLDDTPRSVNLLERCQPVGTRWGGSLGALALVRMVIASGSWKPGWGFEIMVQIPSVLWTMSDTRSYEALASLNIYHNLYSQKIEIQIQIQIQHLFIIKGKICEGCLLRKVRDRQWIRFRCNGFMDIAFRGVGVCSVETWNRVYTLEESERLLYLHPFEFILCTS